MNWKLLMQWKWAIGVAGGPHGSLLLLFSTSPVAPLTSAPLTIPGTPYRPIKTRLNLLYSIEITQHAIMVAELSWIDVKRLAYSIFPDDARCDEIYLTILSYSFVAVDSKRTCKEKKHICCIPEFFSRNIMNTMKHQAKYIETFEVIY